MLTMVQSSVSKIHERKARQICHHKDFRFDLGVGCISCCMKCYNTVGASSAWFYPGTGGCYWKSMWGICTLKIVSV